MDVLVYARNGQNSHWNRRSGSSEFLRWIAATWERTSARLRNLRPQISQGMHASEGRNCRALLPAGIPKADGVPTSGAADALLGGGVTSEERGAGEGDGDKVPRAAEADTEAVDTAKLTEPVDPGEYKPISRKHKCGDQIVQTACTKAAAAATTIITTANRSKPRKLKKVSYESRREYIKYTKSTTFLTEGHS